MKVSYKKRPSQGSNLTCDLGEKVEIMHYYKLMFQTLNKCVKVYNFFQNCPE